MAIISLPTTSVIDISALQTIVNAINRHDEIITQLSSLTVTSNSVDTLADGGTATYNPLTHVIKSGKKLATASTNNFSVQFEGTPAFEGKPVITTGIIDSTGSSATTIVVHDVNSAGFKFDVVGGTGSFYVHWMAFGDRSSA